MTRLSISVEITVDSFGPNSKAEVQLVKDALGDDKTADFKTYCNEQQLPLMTQGDVEAAAQSYVKAREGILP